MKTYAASLVALAALALPLRPQPREDKTGHFHMAGPMTMFLVNGATPAANTTGIPFAIILTEKGAVVRSASFDLKGPKWTGTVHLALVGAKYADGHLTAMLQLRNASGNVIEGVRLDITGATEEYKTKDDQGKEVLKTRPQAASLSSPLLFGDVAKDADADSLVLDVGGLAFKPETTQITINGVLSGLYYLGQFSIGPATLYQMDVDAKGRVYIAGGDDLIRTDADGKDRTVFIKGEPNVSGVVIDPKTGDILVNGANEHIIRYTEGGQEISRLTAEKNMLEWVTRGLRLDKKGRIYNCGDNSRGIQCIENGKKLWMTNLPQDQGELFDVDAAGNVYATSPEEITLLDLDGNKVRKFAIGTDWHIGRLLHPISCRLDSNGRLYVLESGRAEEENGPAAEAPRITVFDREGRPVRIWGRGGKTSSEASQIAGFEIYRFNDLAFGPDGRIYVSGTRPGENDAFVAMFQPF